VKSPDRTEDYALATADVLYADGKNKFALNRYDEANESFNGLILFCKSSKHLAKDDAAKMAARGKLGIVETRQMSTSVMSAFPLIDAAEAMLLPTQDHSMLQKLTIKRAAALKKAQFNQES